jgi:sortase A
MISSRRAVHSLDLGAIERALFVIGVALLTYYGVERLTTFYEQRAAGRELEDVRMAVNAAPPAETRRPAPARAAVIGRIELPRVGVTAIVREGDHNRVLRRAVGHIPQTPLPGEPGNAGLAGHRDTFFRGLRDVRHGDRIVVTTPDSVLHYDVRSTRIVDPTDVSVLKPTSGSTLTLVTCYPFDYIGAAPKRFIVQANMRIGDNGGRDTR